MSNPTDHANHDHSSLHCGYATICAIPGPATGPEQYALPGRQIVSCRDLARAAAVRLDAAIKANGGAQTLRKVFDKTGA